MPLSLPMQQKERRAVAARIILKFPATCRDCGASLQPGQPAKYYGRGRVYGIECHSKPTTEDTGLRSITDLDRQYEDSCDAWARGNL